MLAVSWAGAICRPGSCHRSLWESSEGWPDGAPGVAVPEKMEADRNVHGAPVTLPGSAAVAMTVRVEGGRGIPGICQWSAEMLKRLIAFAFAMVMVAAARAGNVPALQPGEYKVRVWIDLPHVEDTGTSRVATICVSESDIHPTWGLVVLGANNPLARCPASNIRRDRDTLMFDIICPGRNQAVGWARYTIAPQQFTGVIAMKMGGKNMTMIERQNGYRVGSCKPA
jgi:hypothetical protein